MDDSTLVDDLRDLIDDIDEGKWESAVTKIESLVGNNEKKKANKSKTPKIEDDSLREALQDLLGKCQLHLEQYDRILEATNDPSQEPPSKFVQLYAKYRQGQYSSLVGTLSKQTPLDDLFEQHLLAQSSFHTKDTQRAVETYQDIFNSTKSVDGQMEILVNSLAALQATSTPLVNDATTLEKWVTSEASDFLEAEADEGEICPFYDLLYNLGTLELLTQQDGSSRMDQAEQSCRAETKASDLERELAPIILNQVWSRQLKGLAVDPSEFSSSKGSAATIAVSRLNQAISSENSKAYDAIIADGHKLTPTQLRLYWYNRAVLQFRSQDFDACRQSVQSLQATVAAPSKSQKKKASNNYIPLSDDAAAWWMSRVDVLLALISNGLNKTDIDKSIERLEQRLTLLKEKKNPSAIIEHAVAYVLLHLHQLRTPNPTRSQQVEILNALPESIRSTSAVQATLKDISSSKSAPKNGASSLATADALFQNGEFAKAAKMYQDHLKTDSSENLPQQLRLAQALAFVDPVKASDLWESLQSFVEGDEGSSPHAIAELDAEALENQELPRVKNKPSVMEVSTENDGKSKSSKQKALRRRAKKREVYVAKLEERGLRIGTPNPERWIPKYERSGNRRKGGYHKGAQGGGSERDALKLDAAARKAGLVDTGPSTANMKVSSGGGRKGGRRR